MHTGMHFGHTSPSKEAVAEVRTAILDILKSGAEQKTIRAGLDALVALASPPSGDLTGMNISNCSLTGDQTHAHYPEPTDEQVAARAEQEIARREAEREEWCQTHPAEYPEDAS